MNALHGVDVPMLVVGIEAQHAAAKTNWKYPDSKNVREKEIFWRVRKCCWHLAMKRWFPSITTYSIIGMISLSFVFQFALTLKAKRWQISLKVTKKALATCISQQREPKLRIRGSQATIETWCSVRLRRAFAKLKAYKPRLRSRR